ncbi:MAG: DAK2 domain-containing protein [Spirochaetales bacterium]|nr:DAK2 domain-containing protein [Spirochaetales bacterium]
MENLSLDNIKGFLTKMNGVAAANKDYLIDLDSRMGDGDLGLTMAAVFSAMDEFASTYSEDDIGGMLMKGGMAMAKAAPSTMGTLMATGFMRGGKAVKGSTSLGISDVAAFWTAFVEGIIDRGKAKAGEKTIIDALLPAAEAWQEGASDGADMVSAGVLAAKAAAEGLEKTMDMVAQHGRAAYYQEKSRELQDPGATIGSILISSFSEYLSEIDG